MNKNKRFLSVLLIIASVLLCSILKSDSSFAGSVIGTGGTTSSGGSYSYSPGYSYSGTDAVSVGGSWIFYRATGNAVTELQFRPRLLTGGVLVNDTKIDSECSAHTKDTAGKSQVSGFWHYGRNRKGVGTYGGIFDVSLDGVQSASSQNVLTDSYITASGKYGHTDTWNWGHTISYGDDSGQKYYENHYKTHNDSDLKHELYRHIDGEDVKIYYAEKYGSIETVKKEFKQACEYDNRKNSSNHSCDDIWDEVNYFCYWKEMDTPRYTLSAIAIDTSGAKIGGGTVFDSDQVESGKTASVGGTDLPDYSGNGYTFKGWRKNSTDSLTTGNTYSEKITANTTVYAVYELNSYTFRVNFRDTNNASLKNNDGVTYITKTINHGSNGSYTRPAITGYDFQGWVANGNCAGHVKSPNLYLAYTANPPTCDDANGNTGKGAKNKGYYLSGNHTTNFDYTTYTYVNLTNNTTSNAIYKAQPRTLTAYARPNESSYFKSDGTVITTTNGAWTNASTVDYNTSATVSTSSFNPTGYTWSKWGTGGACKNAGTERSCTVKNLKSNTSVNAYYTRNEFQARARVIGGTTWNSDNGKSTGYVKNGQTETMRIECASSGGCKAGWWFDLKTIAGSGETTYTIERRNATKNDDGTWSWSTATNGSTITKTLKPSTNGTNVYVGNADLKVGQTVCYRISYKPFGSEANSTIKRVAACAYVIPSRFQGKTNISGAASDNAGYTTENKSIDKIVELNDCSSVSGCTVTFKHYLKRTEGIGSTTYSVTRTSNLTVSSMAVSAGTIKDSVTFNGETGAQTLVSESKNLKLYPGMVVCETLTFKPNNIASTSNIHTKICASATGNAQPGEPNNPDEPEDPDKPSGDTSFINIKVRNENFSVYNKYQREIYARPGNKVTYRATYYPRLQYVYYLKPERLQINGGTVYPSSGKNNTDELGAFFNKKRGSRKEWNNSINVYSNETFAYSNEHKYSLGDYSKQQETNSHNVSGKDVGKSLNETARTNKTDNTKTTPKQVTFTLVNDLNQANVDVNYISKTAYVRVPYNYQLNPDVKTSTDNPIPAGEEFTAEYEIETKPRPNPETTDNPDENPYATVVGDGMSKLIVYYPDSPNEKPGTTNYGNGKDTNLCAYYGFAGDDDERCGYITTEHTKTDTLDTRLNKGGALEGATNKVTSTFFVRDLPAGSSVCLAAAVYPSNSGSYKNWKEPEGNKKWSISKSKCYTISKKPSIEVWGGNVYSHLPIVTSVAKKNHLAGYTSYNISQGNDYTYVFGSFGELGVISSGNVTGFASGAGTGFALNDTSGDDRGLWPGTHPDNGSAGNNNRITSDKGPGGSKEKNVNFCNRTPLSFSNENCGSGDMVKAIGTSTANDNNIRDKSSIISKLMPGKETNWDKDDITISDTTQSYVYVGDRNLTIDGGRVSSGIKAIHSNRTITITNDIIYEGSYSNLLDVPKVVIYAMSDIIIDCNVDRIDALLIANNKVKTCDSDDIEAKVNSNQLVVNGAIIAKNLIANRTYGAATGANSIIPAEIINFDSTLYLWGGSNEEENSGNSDMDITYIHELSPRY